MHVNTAYELWKNNFLRNENSTKMKNLYKVLCKYFTVLAQYLLLQILLSVTAPSETFVSNLVSITRASLQILCKTQTGVSPISGFLDNPWIVFFVCVIWLTDERHLALFPAGPIVRDPHHRGSLTRRGQGLSLCRLSWMRLCSSDNHYTTAPPYKRKLL